MADTDEELELDVNEKKGSKKTMIMVIVGILLLNGIGVGAWIFLSGGDSKESVSADKSEPKPELGELKYLTMVPEFVVNFGPNSRVRYLQVDLQISTRDEAAFETVNTYRPVIRNDVLVMLSSVKFVDLKDRAGKVALQKKLLSAINKVVISASRTAPVDGEKEEQQDDEVKGPIDNVFFTHFIMQ